MRYRLRTLLVLTAMLPPIIGGFGLSVLWLASLPLRAREIMHLPWITAVGVASVAAYLTVEYAVKRSEGS